MIIGKTNPMNRFLSTLNFTGLKYGSDRKLMRTSFYFIFTAITIILLSSCDNKSAGITHKPDFLLPQLQNQPVHAIELSSDEGKTTVFKKGDEWIVNEPFNFPANFNVINNFLRTILDSEIGKPVKVSHNDLSKLNVHDEGGISAVIRFGDQQSVKLIFGNLSTPKNTGDALMMGVGEIARRYIRVIGDEDNVYLVPLPLVDLSSKPSLWTEKTFVRIPSFKRMIFAKNDKVIHEFRRENLFSSLINVSDVKSINSTTVNCFEDFLKSGQILGIGDEEFPMTQTYPSAYSSLLVEDFLGTQYTFHFGTPRLPDAKTIERERNQASFMDDGHAESIVPFTVNAVFNEFKGNPAQEFLRQSNKKITDRYSEKFLHLSFTQLACIVKYFEG